MQPKYVRQDAELILYGITDWVESTDTGLVVRKPLRDADPTNLLSYKPVHDLDFDGAPSSSTHPLLPYPFTANELAAFFLSDVGAIVLRRFSLADWQPNERALKVLRGDGNDIARGIRQALDALAWAEQVLGTYDHELQQRAYELLDRAADADDLAIEDVNLWEPGIGDAEYRQRNAQRHALVASQEAEATAVMIEHQKAHAEWRRRMVGALLGPVEAVPVASVEVVEVVEVAPLHRQEFAHAVRRTWREVALPYMAQVLEAECCTSAKELFRILERKAGSADSPFERGTGDSRGKLVVREFNQALSLKTMQNAWSEIQEYQSKTR